MTTASVEAALIALFQHLGINQAHIVVGQMVSTDWLSLKSDIRPACRFPHTGDRRFEIHLPPAASQLRTGLPPLHGNPTDGEEAERTADHPSHDHLFFYSPDRKAHADGYAGFHDF